MDMIIERVPSKKYYWKRLVDECLFGTL